MLRTQSLILALMLTFVRLAAQNCQNSSTGLIPINDLGTGFYGGLQGGLYPDGQNEMPPDHQSAGLELARLIRPVDVNGLPDSADGKIVCLAIGMSHARDEFEALQSAAEGFPGLNPYLALVNGAQGNMDIDTIINPSSRYWLRVLDTLSALGFSTAQVQVVWFKQAEAYPGSQGEDTSFVPYIGGLSGKFGVAMNIIRRRFPNASLGYVAGRSYGGYATIGLSPEPLAYYTGWGVKLLIGSQIGGDPSLRYDGADPQAPWLSWGIYLWADGLVGRSDGLEWVCPDDYQSDGTHLSDAGVAKVGGLLLEFFSTDETARLWFMSDQPPVVDDIPDETINAGGRFRPLRLDSYVTDPDDPDSVLTWSWEGNDHLTLAWNPEKRGLRIRPEPGWVGSETIVLTATDPSGNEDSDPATFTVLAPGAEQFPIGSHLRVPEATMLTGNYPNPFNPSTTIGYGLAAQGWVRVTVYTVLGEEVVRLVEREQGAGYHSVEWDGRDDTGQHMAGGVYLLRIEAPGTDDTMKMLLVK